MSTETVRFAGASGATLRGRIHRPAGAAQGWALFAHCFTCSKDLQAARAIAEALAARGFGVLRFDFTGLGQSEGDFADSNFSSDVADVVAAAAWLRENQSAPVLVVGHSLGGAAMLAAAGHIPEVAAVVTVGAPFDPAHVTHLLAEDVHQIEAEGQATVQLAGRPFVIRKQFLDDVRDQDQRTRIGALRRALLVLHSPQDTTVGIDNARQIYEAARHPKSFVTLDGADHLLTDPHDAEYVGEVTAAWASRYLPRQAEPKASGHEHVEVVGGRDGLANHVLVGTRHRMRADEPVAVGGTDSGPAPFDYLLASLGACTSMTLRLYADRKGWPLEEVRVHLDHRVEREKGKRVDQIDRTIDLVGELDDSQRTRILQIADRCPVHRALSGDIRIRTTAGS
ncbi:MAG: putative OsmC-like protein/pimeloyl-ACP methyl ester carboxylesterase [Myxococcota bacterium]